MGRRIVILCLFGGMLALAACAEEPTPTPDLVPTQAVGQVVAEALTVEAPTATHAPTDAALPNPTATRPPTDTAIPSATPTPLPTKTLSATPTLTPSRAPTNTPVPTATPTLTPTASPQPTNTSAPATVRPAQTSTPRPTQTPRTVYPAPTLVVPIPEASLVEQGHFEWQWDGPPLGNDLFFDLRIWAEREEKAGVEPRGAVELTKKTEADVTFKFVPAMEFGEGLYYWTVVVVRQGAPPQVTGEWGEKRWFKYYEPTPTPTPTEEPETP